MVRSLFGSVVALFLCVSASNAADQSTKNTDKKMKEAKIVKVDAKSGTVTVKMDVNGKEVEKTFKLAENIEYLDSTGKVAAVDIFTSGDMALIIEEEGKITKMKKGDKLSSKPQK